MTLPVESRQRVVSKGKVQRGHRRLHRSHHAVSPLDPADNQPRTVPPQEEELVSGGAEDYTFNSSKRRLVTPTLECHHLHFFINYLPKVP